MNNIILLYKIDKMASNNSQLTMTSEDQTLLERKPSYFRILKSRYRRTNKCIRSKAAVLILVWSFAVMMSYGAISNTLRFYMQVLSVFEIPVIGLNIGLFVTSSGFVPIYIFCPLAGFLADTKFSRQKTIITSLYITLLSSIVMVAAGGFALPKVLQQEECNSTRMLYISMGFFVLSFVLLVVGFVGFTANVLQFGLDQLNDSPAEDQSLFIHWMVWVYYLAGIFSQLTQQIVTFVMLTILIPLLIISLCIAHRRKNWFTVDPLKVNPYTLMYKVTKFAYQNKVPVHRSAFTYCEDELPSGLNLAKNKYGGPFTTEQVEDVKSFYGIAKVLLIFGMAFFYSLAATNIIMEFPHKMKEDFYKTTYVKGKFFLFFDVLHSALPVTCIPLYICFIRPYFSHCMPGILKRMGIGMLLLLVALIYSSSLDTAYYIYGSSMAVSTQIFQDWSKRCQVCIYLSSFHNVL